MQAQEYAAHFYNQGLAAIQAGFLQEGKKTLQMAVRVDPGNDLAKKALASLGACAAVCMRPTKPGKIEMRTHGPSRIDAAAVVVCPRRVVSRDPRACTKASAVCNLQILDAPRERCCTGSAAPLRAGGEL